MKALELAKELDAVPENGADPELIQDAAAELRRLAAVEADCATYLKEGETPAERIKRDLGDVDSLMSLYRDVVAERDALKAELERIKALEPVAEVRLNMTGGNAGLSTHIVQLAKGYFPAGTKLYALGSKT